MVTQDTKYLEWRDYFFNDYVIESCNNNISERKGHTLDNYDYTVKINEGEFFSFSKEPNENIKSLDNNSFNSQNNENNEIKYLTPFQSDENGLQHKDARIVNNILPDFNSIEKIEIPEAKLDIIKTDYDLNNIDKNNNSTLNYLKDENNKIEEKKEILKESKMNIISSLPISSTYSSKKNLKLEININNDSNVKADDENNLVNTEKEFINSDLNIKENSIKLIENSVINLETSALNTKNGEINYDIVNLINEKGFNEEILDKYTDVHIQELKDKLDTLKFQNDIVMDENAKLLEILHLYKIIQSIESTEKTNEKKEAILKEEIIKGHQNQILNNKIKNDIYVEDHNYKKDNNTKRYNNNIHQVIPKTKVPDNTNSTKLKFKQYIDKTNVNLVNKKTYKQLHSVNENSSFQKNNIPSNNSRQNEISNNTNAYSNNDYYIYKNQGNINLADEEISNNNNLTKSNNIENFTKNDILSNRNKPSLMSINFPELNKETQNIPRNNISDNNENSTMSYSHRTNQNRNNPFLEDLKKLEMIKSNELVYSKEISTNNLMRNNYSNENFNKNNENYSRTVDNNNNHIKSQNDEIKNDEDFTKNYESIMSCFNKYREANSKVIENLHLLEESNEVIATFNKNKRKKNLQNLEEFYFNNIEPKTKENSISKVNSRYNMNNTNSKSFSEKFILSEISNVQHNYKIIPFHLIEKKKLLINMMNYLYGKNIFNKVKKTQTPSSL